MSERIDLTSTSGPLVNIAAWFSVSVAVLANAGKLYSKLTMTKRLDWDDAAIMTATLMSVGIVVATAKQVDNGLGLVNAALSDAQTSQFYIATYVSTIFYILATFISKFACLYFFLCLARRGGTTLLVRGIMGFIAAWMVAAVFVQAFQCSLPTPWLVNKPTGKCIQGMTFWIVHGVIDILTQAAVSLLPLYLLKDLNNTAHKRRVVMLSFTPNLATIPFIILRLVYLPELYSSSNPPSDSWTLFLISVVQANLAIVVAAVPFAKPFLDSLSVGAITNDIRHGLAWDQTGYAGKTGSRYGESGLRSGGSGSGNKVLSSIRATSKHLSTNLSGNRLSRKPSDNESETGLTYGNELTDRNILRTTETTVASEAAEQS